MDDKQSTSRNSRQGATATLNNANSPPATTAPSSQFGSQTMNGADATFIQGLLNILHELAQEKPQKPGWKRFITHPLLLLFIGSALSLGIGSFLTYFYTRKAKLPVAVTFSDPLLQIPQSRSSILHREFHSASYYQGAAKPGLNRYRI